MTDDLSNNETDDALSQTELANRDNPAAARKAIEAWLPDAQARRVVLDLIAACIQENAPKPQTWGVTLHTNGLHLNVGGGFCVLMVNAHRATCRFLPPEDGDAEGAAFISSLATTATPPLKSAPDALETAIAQADMVNTVPRLQGRILALVKRYVDQFDAMNGKIQRAHSPGVLRYIEEELGITLPNPAPGIPSPAPSSKPRYWVGGHDFSSGSRLTQFLEANAWWHGYAQDETRTEAIEARNKFSQIAIGDYLAVKGYGGQGFLKIYLAGRVEAIDAEKQSVSLSKPPLPLPVPQSIRPGVGGGNYFGTLQEVKNADVIDWAFHQGSIDPPPPPPPPPPPLPPANVILYGPPGTGKTYNTIARAVAIADGYDDENDDAPPTGADAKVRWDELRRDGRIEFVTFHQSYGYEEFVEGIRPVMGDDDDDGSADDAASGGANGSPRYVVAPGVFKRIALRALAAALESVKTDVVHDNRPLPFAEVWEFLREDLENAEPNPLRFPGLRDGGQTQIARISNESGRVYGVAGPWARSFNRTTLAAVYAHYSNTINEINTTDVKAVPETRGHLNYVAAVYNYIQSKQNEWRERREQTPPVSPGDTVPEGAAQDYLTRGEASGYRLRPDADQPPFVLVIDEINRGNISKILGELITLIEDDKRIGGDWGMTVTLPHSREPFGAPRNLYLLGTMNTADKSIALVDVALRRRFEFEEIMPDFSPDVCPGLTAPMRAVLMELNQRITLRKDRDHQIGHAFFVRVHDEEGFNHAFRKKVLPLLQEYFHGDWDALRYVLGDEQGTARFVVEMPGATEAGREARNRYQWYSDGKTKAEAEAFKPLDNLVKGYKIADARVAEGGSVSTGGAAPPAATENAEAENDGV